MASPRVFMGRRARPSGLPTAEASLASPAVVYPVSRKAGRYEGTLANYQPQRTNRWSAPAERALAAIRAEDLVANDPHAVSAVEGIAVNVVGFGLKPQSRLKAKRLGLTEDQAAEFQEAAEAEWQLWDREADAGRRMSFGHMQYLAMRSLLTSGEFLHLPIMLDAPERRYSLAMQAVSPSRLASPSDLTSQLGLRDGVELGPHGEPLAYWIASPEDGLVVSGLGSGSFKRIPAFAAHRPQVLHGFVARENEQIRGHSVLAPAIKFFSDLSDYLDYEVVGQILAASFPVVIESDDPQGLREQMQNEQGERGQQYGAYGPGNMLYLRWGEKANILKSDRVGATFDQFVTRILRAVSAGCGVPYEVLAKDFSKTNYSSARASLLEAWRVYRFYRMWLQRHYCQVVWEMLLEEAFLRGRLPIPPSAPDFYDARAEWCRASWIGPPKGHVDPVKEGDADDSALLNMRKTLREVVEEAGQDLEEHLDAVARERREMEKRGLTPEFAVAARSGAYPSDEEETMGEAEGRSDDQATPQEDQ